MNTRDFPFTPRIWITLGLLASVLAIPGLFFNGVNHFLQAYLFSYLFWFELSLGSLGITMLVYLTNGEWGHISRWISLAGAKTLWLMLVLFVPIALGARHLYPWADPAAMALDPALAHKAPYLNYPFFLLRAALYFAVWIFLAYRLGNMAQYQETYANPEKLQGFRLSAAIGIILYFLTMTFAAIDWIMSLEPDWYSTIFGMLVISAQALSSLSLVLLFLPSLAKREPLSSLITTRNYQDLGGLLFSCVLLWVYLVFSQLLIIWSGDLPVEITWYVNRTSGGWLWVKLFVLAFQFLVPFIFLITERAKRNPRLLAGLSLLILSMRLVDNYWMVMPAFSPQQFTVDWLDFVLPLAIGGLWLAAFSWSMKRTSIFIPKTNRLETAAQSELSTSSQ